MKVELINARLVNEMFRKYLFLKKVSPSSELLKYFICDSNGFRGNTDEKICDEFIAKFNKNFLTPDEVRQRCAGISYAEYSFKFCSRLFGNYVSSLEKEIRFAIRKN